MTKSEFLSSESCPRRPAGDERERPCGITMIISTNRGSVKQR
jgi:hypothetical protein